MFKSVPGRLSALPSVARSPFSPVPNRLIFTAFEPSIRSQHGELRRKQPLLCNGIHSRTRLISNWERFKEEMRQGSRGIWRKHPIALPMTITFVFASFILSGSLLYLHKKRETRLHNYPRQVAEPLRKALYYSEIDLAPADALKWFKRALIAADQLEMNPFSDEVLGIRIYVTEMLERAGLIKGAIGVLEKIQSDCEEWVSNGRRRQLIRDKERAEKKEKKDTGPVDPEVAEAERQILEAEEKEELLRTKVMKRVVGVKIKLAELCSAEYVKDMKKAEQALTSAVEDGATELQRQRAANLPVSSGSGEDFLNLTETASAYTELADLYVKQNKNDLATVLYMQALSLIKEDEGQSTTCRQVVLLNNVSAQMAEQAQKPNPSSSSVQATTGQPITREQLIDASAQWAKKALDVAAHIKPPVRNEDCDQACLTAMYNLGEMAEMQDDIKGARKYYEDVRALASGLAFEEGIQKADEAIKRLKSRK